jgi:sugar (pentulose or hexulose) kinase
MNNNPCVAVLDVGKTTIKLIIADPADGRVHYQRSRPNVVEAGPPFPHFDTTAILDWYLAELAARPEEILIAAIVPVAHGAAVTLLGEDGLAFPVLDYEAAEPDEIGNAYSRIRPGFTETFSPSLPGGMNFGRQVFWLKSAFPEAFGRVRNIIAYPQFWTWSLSGVVANEVTSFGCHSDLWAPAEGRLSSLAHQMGIADLIPPFRRAWDIVGPVLPEIAARARLSPDCQVLCGVHDSNASLLPHLQQQDQPFTLVSTGTWAITMSIGGRLDALDPDRDCLANVDVYGHPVPSSRFMGGREFSMLTEGTDGYHSDPSMVADVLSGPQLVRPGLIPGVGPFPTGTGGWTIDPAKLDPVRRRTAAACYMAELLIVSRDLTGGKGPMVLEGPFALNRSIPAALEALGQIEVRLERNAGGTLAGALELARMAGNESGTKAGRGAA